jgi:hypothetical protein
LGLERFGRETGEEGVEEEGQGEYEVEVNRGIWAFRFGDFEYTCSSYSNGTLGVLHFAFSSAYADKRRPLAYDQSAVLWSGACFPI